MPSWLRTSEEVATGAILFSDFKRDVGEEGQQRVESVLLGRVDLGALRESSFARQEGEVGGRERIWLSLCMSIG